LTQNNSKSEFKVLNESKHGIVNDKNLKEELKFLEDKTNN